MLGTQVGSVSSSVEWNYDPAQSRVVSKRKSVQAPTPLEMVLAAKSKKKFLVSAGGEEAAVSCPW